MKVSANQASSPASALHPNRCSEVIPKDTHSQMEEWGNAPSIQKGRHDAGLFGYERILT
jgi:hypothetical protein